MSDWQKRYQRLAFDRPHPRVLRVTLNRPEKLNAAAGKLDYRQKADRDLNDGRALGVRATPTFFVNGRKLARLSMQDLRALINQELAK